jgi:AAHS family 4-hydroxybenzoate transporter-like MFS transporter
MPSGSLTMDDVIDRRPLGPVQYAVYALCGAAVFVEGFDAQAIGYVAPVLSRNWELRPGALGPVFAAGLMGLALGSFLFAPLADRIGRRPVILWSTLSFGLLTVATGFCQDIETMLWVRLLTGLGLGAAMPNAIALTAEFSPLRSRATAVTLLMCGFGLGSAAGGLVAAQILEHTGWPAVFQIGGGLTLLLVPLLAARLPESIRFLGLAPARAPQLAAALTRFDPTLDSRQISFTQEPLHGSLRRVRELFAAGRARLTVLLWVVYFMSLLDLFLLVNWLPTTIHGSGLSVGTAAAATAMLQIGGILASFLLGPLVDRFGAPRVLAWVYVFGAICIAAIGYAGDAAVLVFITVFGAGFAIVGAQNCNNAVAATLYPTQARATGVGWALAIGRIGSIVGPSIGGAMLAFEVSTTHLLLASAVPALAAAAAYRLMQPRRSEFRLEAEAGRP